jgi:hypothetical protein
MEKSNIKIIATILLKGTKKSIDGRITMEHQVHKTFVDQLFNFKDLFGKLLIQFGKD